MRPSRPAGDVLAPAADSPFSAASVLLLALAAADPDRLTAEERERTWAVQAVWDEMLAQVRANPTPGPTEAGRVGRWRGR